MLFLSLRSRPSICDRKISSLQLIVIAFSMLLLAADTSLANDDAYHLQPQTHLKVSVVEWMASAGEYKEWTALNGEYVVSPVGTVTIPLVGEVNVQNDTTNETAREIAELLKDKTGLASPPTVSVEVTKYPMVYVLGAVEHPGEIEYRPGLTVMQAIAMAGGRERKSNPAGYSELEQLRYIGDLNQYNLRLKLLSAQRARLDAELRDLPSIIVPPELADKNDPDSKTIMDGENRLFAARAEALKQQLQSLDDLHTLLENEIKVLDEKSAVQDRQIKITQDELAGISSLVSKGTLAKTRENSLERVVADLNSAKLDLAIAAMRARQKLSETERDASNLKGQRKTEAGRDLQQVEAEIEETRLKRNTTTQLLETTGVSLSTDANEALQLQAVEYWLTRKGDARSAFKVSAATLLQPNDTLDVRYDLSSGMSKPLQLSNNMQRIQ